MKMEKLNEAIRKRNNETERCEKCLHSVLPSFFLFSLDRVDIGAIITLQLDYFLPSVFCRPLRVREIEAWPLFDVNLGREWSHMGSGLVFNIQNVPWAVRIWWLQFLSKLSVATICFCLSWLTLSEALPNVFHLPVQCQHHPLTWAVPTSTGGALGAIKWEIRSWMRTSYAPPPDHPWRSAAARYQRLYFYSEYYYHTLLEAIEVEIIPKYFLDYLPLYN